MRPSRRRPRQTAAVSAVEAVLLVVAGFGGGLSGSIAGLASLVSYPAPLAVGLPPVSANVTNTVALVCSSAGSITGSRPELRGRKAFVRPLILAGVIGGVIVGALVLLTPADAFERVVPVLVALASISMLFRRRLLDEAASDGEHVAGRRLLLGVGVIGVYGGYFGAGAAWSYSPCCSPPRVNRCHAATGSRTSSSAAPTGS